MSTNPRKNIARRKRIHKRLDMRCRALSVAIRAKVFLLFSRLEGQTYTTIVIDDAGTDLPPFHTLWPHPDAPRSPVDGA